MNTNSRQLSFHRIKLDLYLLLTYLRGILVCISCVSILLCLVTMILLHHRGLIVKMVTWVNGYWVMFPSLSWLTAT